MADPLELGAELAAVAFGGLARLLPWRAWRIAAHEGGLAIARVAVERVPWAAIDAVLGGGRIAIHAGGRVVARLPDTDASDRLIAIVVARAGLEWLPTSARRRGPPAMAVRPAVAARLRDSPEH
ncbi:MAG: hypothetical protein K8W52_10480 [Deltaproteobacteria bacterium]|nr:hypothetical protein [Deltaproteobacteria bacterium]